MQTIFTPRSKRGQTLNFHHSTQISSQYTLGCFRLPMYALCSCHTRSTYRCNLAAVVAETDRILRPEGKVIVRDNAETVNELENMFKSMKWEIRFTYFKDNEGLLCVQKSMWRPSEAETLKYAIAQRQPHIITPQFPLHAGERLDNSFFFLLFWLFKVSVLWQCYFLIRQCIMISYLGLWV